MTALVTIAAAWSAAASILRWLRVAQREHYLTGSCVTTALRWAGTRPPNAFIASGGVLFACVAVAGSLAGLDILAGIAALLAAVLTGVFPLGMPLLGTPRLSMTRRARSLTVAVVVLVATEWVVLALLVGAAGSAGAVVVSVAPLVDGALAALAPLERRLLERHRRTAARKLASVDPFVIAVTGSWGKTSTKGHIADLMGDSRSVVASPASWNNTAGLSRTINEHLTAGTEVLVAEMGMYGPGEIRAMCAWVKPDVSVICAIGPMHLERAGSLEAIARAKAEILERAEVAVLWVDDPLIAQLAESAPCPRVLRVGTRGSADLDVAVEVDPDSGDATVWSGDEALGTCPSSSGVHAANLGCAVGAALAYGLDARLVARNIAGLTSPEHRAVAAPNSQGVLVIDDTFNSNPVGASVAVDYLARSVEGHRVVVTPGMVELGAIQDDENHRLARTVVESGATLVVVGWTNRRSLVAGANGSAITVADREAAVAWTREHLGSGDGVLWENDLPDHYP